MAIVIYKCDTCNRTIEKTQNKEGLEVVGRCIITNNCKGSLFKEKINLDKKIARAFPEPVAGLVDWRQNRILHTHEQLVQSNVWKVDHSLHSNPAVSVFLQRPDSETGGIKLIEVEPLSVTYTNENSLIVNLQNNEIGVVQCVARNSTNKTKQSTDVIQNINIDRTLSLEYLTVEKQLTIATTSSAASVDVEITFLSIIDLSVVLTTTLTFNVISAASLWFPANRIFVKGKYFKVRSTEIDAAFLLANNVKNNSPFYISKVDGVVTTANNGYFLLAKPPYEASVDRNLNYLINLNAANATNAATTFLFKDNEMWVADTIKQSVFPSIQPIST